MAAALFFPEAGAAPPWSLVGKIPSRGCLRPPGRPVLFRVGQGGRRRVFINLSSDPRPRFNRRRPARCRGPPVPEAFKASALWFAGANYPKNLFLFSSDRHFPAFAGFRNFPSGKLSNKSGLRKFSSRRLEACRRVGRLARDVDRSRPPAGESFFLVRFPPG